MPAQRPRRTRHVSAPRSLSLFHKGATTTSAAAAPALDPLLEPVLEIDEIQGCILPGFGTAHLALLGLRITRDADAAAHARQWLRELAPLITTTAQMQQVREVRRAVARATSVRPALPEVLLGVALSAGALAPLELAVPSQGANEFLAGINAFDLQDELDANGIPLGWKVGATAETTPDVLLTVASDHEPAVLHALATLKARTGPGTGLEVLYEENGHRLLQEREHFGFRDGLSQPGVRGRLSDHPESFITRRQLAPDDPLAARFSRPGQPLIMPGQFLFGYQEQDDEGNPGRLAEAPVPWMKNGSFLVFRRLSQDVAALHAFAAEKAPGISAQMGRAVPPEEVLAWIVGRWPDGQPLVRTPLPPTAGTPAPGDLEINHFDYQNDLADVALDDGGIVPGTTGDDGGMRCPHFAHIRKVNLRDKLTDKGSSFRFRMLRRGIPFGPLWQPGETEPVDRGLLFLSFQRKIETFITLTTHWMNGTAAPEGRGHDLLVGANLQGRETIRVAPDGSTFPLSATPLQRWIRATGGGFFFTPPVSTFKKLRPTMRTAPPA